MGGSNQRRPQTVHWDIFIIEFRWLGMEIDNKPHRNSNWHQIPVVETSMSERHSCQQPKPLDRWRQTA